MLAQLQAERPEALEDLRDLARGIYPPLLADKGLAAALEAQARKAAVADDASTADEVGRYPQDIESAVYFCTPGGAEQRGEVRRRVARLDPASATADGTLSFRVIDDGRGFDSAATGYGTGLQGIADRLAALGGEVEITSTPGAGTTIAGRLPTGA